MSERTELRVLLPVRIARLLMCTRHNQSIHIKACKYWVISNTTYGIRETSMVILPTPIKH